MSKGRHRYPKVTVVCRCGWRGKRSTFMSRKPCPRCYRIPKEAKRADARGMFEKGDRNV